VVLDAHKPGLAKPELEVVLLCAIDAGDAQIQAVEGVVLMMMMMMMMMMMKGVWLEVEWGWSSGGSAASPVAADAQQEAGLQIPAAMRIKIT